MVNRSAHLLGWLAIQIPSGRAINQASAVASTVKSRVLRARSKRRFLTGALYAKE
jgi:hypothetical protein